MFAILLSVLVVLILILFLRIRVSIIYSEKKLSVILKVLFIKINLISDKKKKPKKARQEKSEESAPQKKEKAEFFSDKLIRLGERIERFADTFRKTTELTKKHFNVKKFETQIVIGTGDAASTAITTGMLWGVVYNFISILGLLVYIDSPKVDIKAEYNENVFNCDAQCIIETRIAYIIFITALILLKNRKTVRRKKNG